ncbi:acyl-CoA hydrolase 2 isoform X4 [Musa acuminata AAA Group]|uniref:acyl-CoA hydrolase 2 isoform X4 n=1 Tax=Musa acuminata AAA Group TaxID=214697 RepID=UPI0031D34A58
MDRGKVLEFLRLVPFLQRLPGSSLRKLAEVVQVKQYELGEYVVREGEIGDGIYFILEGQVEISGSASIEEGNHSDLLLKQYDYFGYESGGSIQQATVVALSKLTCLVLPDSYSSLLQPKSIWYADESPGGLSLMEHILCLEPLEALAAASKTVDCLKLVHSLHAMFILAGENNSPIIYLVHRVRDGNSFATRRVDAKQNGYVIFTLFASFQKVEEGFEHQEVFLPHVPAPEMLLNIEELRERRLADPHLSMEYRNKIAKKKFIPWPIEIRFCEDYHFSEQSPPRFRYWLKVKGKLTDDPALHRCVLAYASDLIFGGISLNPHRRRGLKIASLSLDHSIWFHRSVRADDWLLFVIESPSASGGRGLSFGRMFNRRGELIMSLTQEGLIRKAKQQNEDLNSKL